MTKSPVELSARAAYKMAGVGPSDMDIASLYDCYTITVIIEFEDAGFAPKGEGGTYILENDVTYKSDGIAIKHPRRPALVRPARHRGRHVARHGGGAAADGPAATAGRKTTSTTASSTAEVAD